MHNSESRRSRRLKFIAIASTGALVGSLILASPGASAQTAPPANPKESIDDLFARISERVPNFAGMFLDRPQGEFVVRVKGGNTSEGAIAGGMLHRELARDHGPLGRLKVIDADYSFLEMQRWYTSLRSVLSLDGVQSTDIDERANRLAVGVSTGEGQAAVERRLPALGVPPEVVELRPVEPAVEDSSLRDRHRPLVGGLQIVRDLGGGFIYLCTMGFNAIKNGVTGFVTNSHCTSTQFGFDSTIFHQVALTTADRVGTATFDPNLFSGGACVWAGWKCRWSDSAFVSRTTGVSSSIGRIARPAPSLVSWNGVDTFRVVGEADFGLDGEEVTKVGQKTGRTKGTVTSTCSDVAITFAGPQVALLCQETATYISDEGDSGSPVFVITPGTTNVTLVGIHWGGSSGNKRFSPFGYGVEDDLGFLSTCTSGC